MQVIKRSCRPEIRECHTTKPTKVGKNRESQSKWSQQLLDIIDDRAATIKFIVFHDFDKAKPTLPPGKKHDGPEKKTNAKCT